MTVLSYCLLGIILSYLLFSLISYASSSHPSNQAFIARAIQLSPFIQINTIQIWGLICLLGAMLASMLIQFIANTPQDAAAQVGIDAIAEIILIPFYASALFVVVSSLIIMSRIRSGAIAQP